MVMTFICLAIDRVHDKDRTAAFKNHIITRMQNGSLNNPRPFLQLRVKEHGYVKGDEIISHYICCKFLPSHYHLMEFS